MVRPRLVTMTGNDRFGPSHDRINKKFVDDRFGPSHDRFGPSRV